LGDTIYFSLSNNSYYNISSSQIESYTGLFSDYYTVTAIQLAYSFSICNGEVGNYTIVANTEGSFSDSCDEINGIYYQNNEYIAVPTACQGLYSKASDATIATLYTCAALATLTSAFYDDDCESSFTSICEAAYTDNPPFSCSTEEAPDFLTTLGSSLANATALWSFLAIVISISLRKIYPGGVMVTQKQMYGSSKVVPRGIIKKNTAGDEEEEEEDDDDDERGSEAGKPGAVAPLGVDSMDRGETGKEGADGELVAKKKKKKKKKKDEEEEEEPGCIGMLCDECEGCELG